MNKLLIKTKCFVQNHPFLVTSALFFVLAFVSAAFGVVLGAVPVEELIEMMVTVSLIVAGTSTLLGAVKYLADHDGT